MNHSSLVDILHWRAKSQSKQCAFTFLIDGENQVETLTFAQLDSQAKKVAASLQGQIPSRERAILLIPTGLEFIAAFMGCMYANVTAIPVPAHFKDPSRLRRILPRLQAIAQDAQAKMVLTTKELMLHIDYISQHAPDLSSLHWIAIDELSNEIAKDWFFPSINENDLVFLQYSSGSTGKPKGVMVSHANLMHNEQVIKDSFEHSEHSIGVSWLPAYHDMGLVADILQPIYSGFKMVFMSPFDFIKRPLRWLEAVSNYKATTSGAPNFAYSLCHNKVTKDELQAIDLSSWKIAYNCAEPVSAEVIKNFTETFSICGFKEQAFFPYLGMAEGTLMVSRGKLEDKPRYLSISRHELKQGVVSLSEKDKSITLVGNGQAIPDQEILIVNPETLTPCPQEKVGEIWISGPSVAKGYWSKESETQQVFKARVKNGKTDFLRTGDLGFLKDNELFITGRLKDLMIFQGQNIYPQDIEQSVEKASQMIRPGCCAAFSIDSESEERLVVVAELQERTESNVFNEIALAIKSEVFAEHQLMISHLVFIKAKTLPKTSSGKVQRKATKEHFSYAKLHVIHHHKWNVDSPSQPALENSQQLQICQIFKEVLGLKQVNIDDNFFDWGGHSLLAIQLINRIQTQLQIELQIMDLFEYPTIRTLAALVQKKQTHLSSAITPGDKIENIPLSYAQERMWFLNQLTPLDYAYNMPSALKFKGTLNPIALEKSLNEIITRHESLRTNFFTSKNDSPIQMIHDSVNLKLDIINLTHQSMTEARYSVQEAIEMDAKVPFDLVNEPLLRIKLYQITTNEYVLYVNMHHIISDGWSMGVFFQELSQIYNALINNQASPMKPLSIQYKDYTLWQRNELKAEKLNQQLNYWKTQLANLSTVKFPTDYPRPAKVSLNGARECLKVPLKILNELKELSAARQVSLYMVLLAAYFVILNRYTKQNDLVVGSPIAGRNRTENENLIGFFVNTLVLRSNLKTHESFNELLAQIKTITTEAYANQDIPFEKIVSEVNPLRETDKNPLFQIVLALQNTIHEEPFFENIATEAFPFSTETTRMDLELHLWERADGLECQLIYNRDLFAVETIQQFLLYFTRLLKAIIENPNQPIESLSLLSKPEHQENNSQYLQHWGKKSDTEAHTSILKQLKALKENKPDFQAIQTEKKTFPLEELFSRGEHVFQQLAQTGIQPGSCIGLCIDNSLSKMIALLAAMMGQYVVIPIPESYNKFEKDIIIHNANVEVVISLKNNEITLQKTTNTPFKDNYKPFFILQPCWNAQAQLCLLPFTQLDVLKLIELNSVDHPVLDKNIWLSMWRSILRGQIYQIQTPIPEYQSEQSFGQRIHLMDLDPTFQYELSSPMLEMKKSSSHSTEVRPLAYVNGGELNYPIGSPRTVTETILNLQNEPHKDIIIIDESGKELTLDYKTLIEEAKCICKGLQNQGLKPGDTVILQCSKMDDHFRTFLGIILGGFIPLTVAIPPTYHLKNAIVQKLVNVIQLMNDPLVICNTSNQEDLEQIKNTLNQSELRIIPIETLKLHSPTESIHQADREDIAFYQLSSGSTGVPKCIQITHKGIIAHCESAGQANGYNSDDILLNWIPVDHVVPILMWFLQALYQQAKFINVDKDYILSKPLRWLDLLEQYQVTLSWAPNFGFKLVNEELKKAEHLEPYNLKSIKSFLMGGEQVTKEVISDFLNLTQAYGIQETVATPGFGMAETCTAITLDVDFNLPQAAFYTHKNDLNGVLSIKHEADEESVGFINLGRAFRGIELRIADEHNQTICERQIGRLQVRGEVITKGYYKNARSNQEAFVGEGWFNTGDLGFLYQNNLYITGREKEMIVVRGANIFCYEIEEIVSAIEGVSATFVGVFPIKDIKGGTEGFGVAYAPEKAINLSLIKPIKKTITEQLGISPDLVIPIEKSKFPKTTSGKVQRSKIAQGLINGEYRTILKSIDLFEANEHTISNWFYKGVWLESNISQATYRLDQKDLVLVFTNQENNPELEELIKSDFTTQFRSFQVLRLETVDHWKEQLRTLENIDLLIIQPKSELDMKLLKTYLKIAQILLSDELKSKPLNFIHLNYNSHTNQELSQALSGALQGFFRSFEQERLNTSTAIIECVELPGTQLGKLLTAELEQGFEQANRIRYQHLKRSIHRIEKVRFTRELLERKEFLPGCTSLVLGGLGGIGFEICHEILQHPGQTLIISGRSALISKRLSYEKLNKIAQKHGNEVSYIQFDFENESFSHFKQLLLEKIKYKAPLKYLIQTAGAHFEQKLIKELDEASFLKQLMFKIQVSECIRQFVSKEISVIDIGSVNGYFGGFQVSGYALAQGFIDSLFEYYSKQGINYHCFNQTMWKDTGLSIGQRNQGLNKGFQTITKTSGIQSFRALLKMPPGVYYIGLEASKPFLNSYLTNYSQQELLKTKDTIPVIEELLSTYLTGTLENQLLFSPSQLITNSQPIMTDQSNQFIGKKLAGELILKQRTYLTQTGLIARFNHQWDLLIVPLSYSLEFIETALRSEAQYQDIFVNVSRDDKIFALIQESDAFNQNNLESLLETIKSKLPWPLRPTSYEFVKELPLTTTGLIDRQALSHYGQSNSSYKAPRDEIELFLVQLYSELLDIEQVGVEDDFFTLGGHSLLATQLVSRIRDHFQVELPLNHLFEAPIISVLAKVIKSTQQTLLPTIKPISRDQPLQLSYAQERLWFMDQFQPDSIIYSTPMAFQLKGQLNISILEKSIQSVIERHEALRIRFEVIDDQVFQSIAPLSFQLKIVKVNTENTLPLLHQEVHQPFKLNQDQLIRVKLYQLDDESYLILFNLHHIISDGWSMELLFREIQYFYQCYLHQNEPSLKPLELQYIDYIYWQKNNLHKSFEKQLSYWKKQLANSPGLLQLPTDRPRPSRESYRGGKLSFCLSSELSTGLIELAQSEEVTSFILFLSAFQVLLYRFSHQSDILIGTPIANRRVKEIEAIIGLFVNTLVIRGNLKDSPSFKEFLLQLKETCLNAYDNQDIPFEKLVQTLNPKRSLSHHPIFQVMFLLEDSSTYQLELEGLDSSPLDLELGLSKFDLSLELRMNDYQISGTMAFNTDIFNTSTIERLIDSFENLLQSILSNHDQSVDHLSILSKNEQIKLLYEWNDTARDYPYDNCIHHFFEEQVIKNPEQIALVFKGESLSYGELNEKANQLAHYLLKYKSQSEFLVGLNFHRSLEMMVGLLGILKAGGAYVPLDPTYPLERLNFMIEDTQVALVLNHKDTQNFFSNPLFETYSLDLQQWELKDEKTTNPDLDISLDQLISIIYTSGSTGKPKGVMNLHKGVYNHLVNRQATLKMKASDRIIQKTSLNFDGSVWECFWPLMVGATIYLAPSEDYKDSHYLCQFIQKHKITMIDFAPSGLVEFLKEPEVDNCLSLRRVFCGSESLSYRLQDKFFKQFDIDFTHGYGPTESTVGILYHECQKSGKRLSPLVPIGKPIPNTQIYLLDSNLNPVPIGVVGEMYIGGNSLARGYLNRPELTKERFIHNPFHGGKMYKTGDLARYLLDGNIEFAGRSDQQIKLRGFRIELGEIEAILKQYNGVVSAIANLHVNESGFKQILAYIVSNDRLKISQLKHHLKTHLPDYMVPSAIIFLESIPLDPNGKIDRRALPLPENNRSQLDSTFIAPSNQEEITLCTLFSRVLNIAMVGIHDSFFDLGGHSLLATQLVSRIREILHIDIPLRTIFEYPSVAELIPQLRKCQQPSIIKIKKVARDEPLILSFAQERLWFLDQLEPDSALYNIPIALQLKGLLNFQALQKSFQLLIARHESLRTQFIAKEGRPYQIIAEPSSFPISVQDFRKNPKLAHQLVKEEAMAPFNLENDSLIRVKLFQVSSEVHILTIVLHHIIADGWSFHIFAKELKQYYQHFNQDKNHEFTPPPLPIQYSDFAQWQRTWFKGKIYQRQLTYWKNQLAKAPTLLKLPTDRPRPALETFRGTRKEFHFESELTIDLKTFAQEQNVTLFILLLSAFQVLLSRYSGQNDVLIGIPIANRRFKNIENLIGFFVNTLVMRGNLSHSPGFTEFLMQMKERALEAYSHQDLPFEKLVEELNPKRSLSHHPIFQVMFVLQDENNESFGFENLQVTAYDPGSTLSRFDLAFELIPVEDGLKARIEYNQDLFNDKTISTLIGSYQCLLQSILAEPEQQVSLLNILPPEQSKQILIQWNATRKNYSNKAIHQLLEEQVVKFPKKIALYFEEQNLSYKNLNIRANQMAHFILRSGIEPGTLIGICMERSLEMVIAILAILKAGCAYLPLDPNYPQERLAFILKDSQCPLVITQKGLFHQFSPHVNKLTFDEPEIKKQPELNPVINVKQEHLAYVIYTSGSTGQPKGVMLSHRSVVNFLQSMAAQPGISSDDRLLAVTSISFDIAGLEIFLPLSVGAQIVIASKEASRDSKELIHLLNHHQISIMQATPASWKLLLDKGWKNNQQIKILCGGEALSESLCQRILEVTPHLWNMYGPTETTIWSTIAKVHTLDELSIGQPIANTEVFVLDEHLNPVPIGVAGELHIGGSGLAKGYLNRPDLTSERFIQSPFDPSKTLYKTGDSVTWLNNGTLKFNGRIDFQFKIRGFRVEPAEIERTIKTYDGVKEAVVICKKQNDIQSLMAYIIPTLDHSSQELEIEHIEQWKSIYQSNHSLKSGHELGSNFSIWNSSFNGQAIPLNEMQEWRDATVKRIQSLQPNNVYEIGCGTGLILSRIAPDCQSYWASDFSSEVLNEVSQLKLDSVKTIQRTAENFEDIHAKQFDTIILNSVIQYFPSAQYLIEVLKGAILATQAGGHVFIGDVRNYQLLTTLHTSIALFNAPENASIEFLYNQVHQAVQREEELCFSPRFFMNLKSYFPRISAVEILLKEMTSHNELSLFRYDVILHIEAQTSSNSSSIKWHNWNSEMTIENIQLLQEKSPEPLGIKNIPDARLQSALHAEELLNQAEKDSFLKDELISPNQIGLDPNDFHTLNSIHSIKLYLSKSSGHFDLIFSDRPHETLEESPHGTQEHLTNIPLKTKLNTKLIPPLKAFLSEKIPAYMLPNYYIILERFPLTPNGKIDRKALPNPEKSRELSLKNYVAPHSREEIILCELFAEVLDVQKIGIHDDFFDLGGHSLLATQLAARIRDQMQIDLPLRLLFEYPNASELAIHIKPTKKNAILSIDKAPAKAPLKLSYSQELWWTIFNTRQELEHGVQNTYAAIKLEGPLDIKSLEKSFQEVIQRHESLRTTFVNIEKRPRRVIKSELDFHLLVSKNYTNEQSMAKDIQTDAQAPFDLVNGPLIRAKVYVTNSNNNVLMFSVSHLVFDGWSMKILIRELDQFYRGFITGNPIELPDQKLQYSDYVYWHRKWIKKVVLKKQLFYWLLKGKDMPVILDLPTDKPRTFNFSMKGQAVSFEFSKTFVQTLQNTCQRENITLYMLLLGAFQILLHQYSGHSDIFVGTPIANRRAKESENMIGLFVNFIVLRANLDGEPDFSQFFKQVKETCLGAYSHQDLPFQILFKSFKTFKAVTELKTFKSQQTMRSNVMFNFLDDFVNELSIGNLRGTLLPYDTQYSSQTMHMLLTRTSSGITGDLVYNSELFYEETIVKLTKQYKRILESIISDSTLSVMSEREQLESD